MKPHATLAVVALCAALAVPARAQQSAAPSAAPATEKPSLLTLSSMTIQGERETGYQATSTISASRLNVPLKEVPLNIAVLTSDFVMDSLNLNQRDALNWHAAVDDKRVRGFGTEEFFRNGFLHFSDTSGFLIQRVEIIRGPTAVLNGPLTPGGAINFITKQATLGDTFGEARIVTGTGNGRDQLHGYFDVNMGNLVEAAHGPAVAFRFLSTYQSATGLARGTSYSQNAILPSLKLRPWQNTLITLEYYGYDIRDRHDRAFGRDLLFPQQGANNDARRAAGTLPVAIAYNIPHTVGWYGPDTEIEEDLDDVSINLNQQIGDSLLLDLGFNRHARDFKPSPGTQPGIAGVFPIIRNSGAPATSTNPADFHLERELQIFLLDANLNQYHASLTWQPVLGSTARGDHRFQAGFDLLDYQRTISRQQPFSVANPTQIFRDSFTVANWRTDDLRWFDKNSGLYTWRRVFDVDDTFEFRTLYANHHGKWLGGKLITLAGYYQADLEDRRRNVLANTPEVTNYDGGKALPQLGAVYFLTSDIGFYANYSESLRPSGVNRANVESPFLPPTRGEMVDIGTKLELLNDKLHINASFYTVKEVDRAQEFPLGSGIQVPIGEVESQGIDLDAFYYPAKDWSVMFSYATNRMEITGDRDPTQIGRKVPGFIKHKLGLWTKYSFADGSLAGLSIGGGLSYRGEQFREYRFGTDETWWNPVTRVDLFAQYNGEFLGRKYELAVNLRNLTGEANISSSTPIVINQSGYQPGTNEPYEFESDPEVLVSVAFKF